MTLHLPPALGLRLAGWARRAAPREACGLLIGRGERDATVVERVTWARNLDPGWDRYELDPSGHLAAERAARGAGLEVVGVWHSHPRGPASPSETDRAAAYEGWSYVVVGLAGPAPAWRSFRLTRGRFEEEECTWTTSEPGSRPRRPASPCS